MERGRDHFLVVTYPAQGHINPALHLANRLARTTGSAVTFSTTVSAHRRMFPDSAHRTTADDAAGLITYTPFSDGYDNGFKPATDDVNHFFSQFKSVGSRTFSSLIEDLAARGRPVTCVIYTILLSWAADVARDHGIPSALYWIQPATVFDLYYHYFHGYQSLFSADTNNDPSFTVKLPGLPPLRIKELPSFLTTPNDPYAKILDSLKETIETLDRESELTISGSKKPKVLMNTFDELEPDALSNSVDGIESVAIGPVLPSDGQDSPGGDLFKKADEKAYVEFLDSKPENSVVYVSFGSLSVVKKEQMEEILRGLRESGRPYLWVVRKDSRWEGVELGDDVDNGMVVEWCSQVRVLSHRSVGCFVTHCGWNSTVESLVCGVPMVGVPQWTDQTTNARLVEGEWKTGVRVGINEEGVLEGKELKRCLDLVMGDGENAAEIRKNAAMWRDKARESISEGGSSDRNLRAFVEAVSMRG